MGTARSPLSTETLSVTNSDPSITVNTSSVKPIVTTARNGCMKTIKVNNSSLHEGV